MINDSDLDSIDWSSMGHAYGRADDVPTWLRNMASPDPEVRERAFGKFYSAAHHQGDVYPCTTASLPFLFAMADDPAAPDRASVVELLVSIGSEAAERVDGIWMAPDGTESTAGADSSALIRERGEAFVAYASDPDTLVRGAAIPGLGLFLDDAERAAAVLRDRLKAETGITERLLVIETMADLALRLPAAQAPAREWLGALADDVTTDPDIRLAALVQRAHCVSQGIDADTVPTAIALLRRITPAPEPAPEPVAESVAESGDDGERRGNASGPCTCATEPAPASDVPPHIAAAFAGLERRGRAHAPTTRLLITFHAALGGRVDDRTALLTEQLRSPDRATRYDAIGMAKSLIGSWRGDHTHLVGLLADCLSTRDAYTTAAAAEALGSLGAGLAEPAREALAAYVAEHRVTHRPDAWASPHPLPRRAHQEAVLALAGLGDERALPGLLTALDTGTDAWRAVNAAGRLPQCAAELAPRLILRLAEADYTREWPVISPPALMSALAKLGDPAAVPALADAVRGAVRHKQTCGAAPALDALASFGTRAAAALDVVRPLADADDVTLRVAAIRALWELEHRPEDVVPRLERVLDEAGHHDTYAVLDVLARVGPPAAPVLPRLRRMVSEATVRHPGDAWILVHGAPALWEIGGEAEAGLVVRSLLTAWDANGSTADRVVACLDRMGRSAKPAVPRIQAALARSGRRDDGTPWGSSADQDEELLRTGRAILARFGLTRTEGKGGPTGSAGGWSGPVGRVHGPVRR
ncbi:HEAT repeat domain-containing protein [Streptomyces laurentii]|uniref:HEAT repeat domain-containing protein n=1 Tax=Streptomyces laurentii TaxID=39478 RepID=UPI003681B5C0